MCIEYHKMAIAMACFNCYGIPNLLVYNAVFKIHDTFKVNQTWLGLGSSNPNASMVGMLYDLTTFDIEAHRFFGKVINEMKTQDIL